MGVSRALKKRRKELGYTLLDIANKVGVSEATVQRWESENIKNLRYEKIIKLADVLEIQPSELMGWDDTRTEKDNDINVFTFDNIHPIEVRKIPLLGSIACGEPIFADEDRESYVLAGTDINADFCLRAKGDSMTGARIHDGDIVFIQKQDIVDDGEIAAVVIDGDATLKRVYYERGQNRLTLLTENPKYRPLVYEGEALDYIYILGRAIAFQSDIV